MPERSVNSPAPSALGQARARGRARASAASEDRLLDAAASALLEVGLRRLTMADIAARAGVARGTLYRRWGNVREVVAALLTRTWADVTTDAVVTADREDTRGRLVDVVVGTVSTMRAHALQQAVLHDDPELLLPYLLQRVGRTGAHLVAVLETAVREGHDDGSVRVLDATLQARTVLLLAWSFVVTAPAVTGEQDGTGPGLEALDAQLGEAVDRYLAPA